MNFEIIKEISIDFYNSRYIAINTKQYDKSSRYIVVSCYDKNTFFPIDNIYNHAFVRYRKPDDNSVFNCCDITKDGKILIELTEQMQAFVGKCFFDLVIVHNEPLSVASIDIDNGELLTSKNTGILSTMLICVNVIENAVNHIDIESSDEFNALNELLIKATNDYTSVMRACKISEENAKDSEEKALVSEINARTSENNAKDSEEKALASENASKSSENAAKISEQNASASEINARTSENNAKDSEEKALASEMATQENKYVVVQSTADSINNAMMSKSYAIGGTGSRNGEDTDNSKYYYDQTKAISDNINGMFVPMGTITFEELNDAVKNAGYMYCISNDFITDNTFKCGSGISYHAGTIVYYTYDGYWDCIVTQTLVVTDNNDGVVTIRYTADSIATDEAYDALTNTIIELQNRIKILEDKNMLEIVE